MYAEDSGITGFTRKLESSSNEPVASGRKHFSTSMLIAIILLGILGSFVYNASNNNIQINKPSSFPLLYFYPENGIGSGIALPLGQNAYSLSGSSLYIPSTTSSLILNRSVSNEDFNINATIVMNGNLPVDNSIVSTNKWSIKTYREIEAPMLAYRPADITNVINANASVPGLNSTSLYFMNGDSNVVYSVNTSFGVGKTFFIAFKPTKISPVQSLPFYLDTKSYILEIALYPSYGVIAFYNKTSDNGWIQTSSISTEQWNFVTLTLDNGYLNLDYNGITYSVEESPTVNSINIMVGNPLNNRGYSFIGYTTPLYVFTTSSARYTTKLFLATNNSYYPISTAEKYLNIYFNNSILIVNGEKFTVPVSSYICFIKQGLNFSIIMRINSLTIINLQYGFFMIPAFIAFYFGFAFAIYSVAFILMNQRQRMDTDKQHSHRV